MMSVRVFYAVRLYIYNNIFLMRSDVLETDGTFFGRPPPDVIDINFMEPIGIQLRIIYRVIKILFHVTALSY